MKTLVCSLLLLFVTTPAWADITLSSKTLKMKEVTTIKVTNAKKIPIAKASLVATYYPNSNIEREELIKGKTDTGGLVRWKPTSPGIVVLTARIVDGKDKKGKPKMKTVATSNVSVNFSGMPMSGLIVFLAAGSFLFGGLLFGFRRAFGSEG